MVRCRSLSFIISCCQRDKTIIITILSLSAIGYRLSVIGNRRPAASTLGGHRHRQHRKHRMSSHRMASIIHPGIRTKSKLIEITNNIYKLLQIDPNEYKSDPKKYKSVQKTTNRIELLQIDQKTTNRTEPRQIDPKKYKSNRTTTNRTEPLQIEIDPKKYKSIQKSTNRSKKVRIDPI